MPKANFIALDLKQDIKNEVHQICLQIKEQILNANISLHSIPKIVSNIEIIGCHLV